MDAHDKKRYRDQARKEKGEEKKKTLTMSGCKPRNLRTGGRWERTIKCEDEKGDHQPQRVERHSNHVDRLMVMREGFRSLQH